MTSEKKLIILIIGLITLILSMQTVRYYGWEPSDHYFSLGWWFFLISTSGMMLLSLPESFRGLIVLIKIFTIHNDFLLSVKKMFSPEELAETIEGDTLERFQSDLNKYGLFWAHYYQIVDTGKSIAWWIKECSIRTIKKFVVTGKSKIN